MSASVYLDSELTRTEQYNSLSDQIKLLTSTETNLIANLANIMAVLKSAKNYFWVGVYLVEKEELILGPFQGPLACTRIKKGKGVCGTCWERNASIIVPDVEQFDGHIACSSETKSELVIPIRNNRGEVVMILDADSEKINDFDEEDRAGMEGIAKVIEGLI